MELLFSLLSTTGAGGIMGLVGSWLTKREERENLKVTNAHEKAMATIRMHEQKLEANHELAMADKQLERAQVEGNIAIEQGEIAAFNTSLLQQGKSTGIAFVEAIRGLMRPAITIYLLVIASIIAYNINGLIGGIKQLPTEELLMTYKEIIQQLLFLTATAVTWWFGLRPSTKIT